VLLRNDQEIFISGELTVELMQAVFNKGACFRFQAKGFSMLPFILDNDILTLCALNVSPVSLGKVVACAGYPANKLVIHRIVAMKKEQYLIKGDSCFKPDCFLRKEDILGCVIGIERQEKVVRFGLGPERRIIAFLNRSNLLFLASVLWRKIPGKLRRFIKCQMLSLSQ
jgi:hypothetical protein